MSDKGFDLPDEMDSVEEQPEVEVEQEDGEDYEVEETTEYEDDEEDVEEESTPQPKQSKKLYTPDEIKQMLRDKDFSAIDTSRLSEEGRAVMKAMQAGLTPKLQESAELRRELSEIRTALKDAVPKPKPKDIYEAYDQNPEETMQFVNSQIKRLIDDGADIHDIEKVREVREQLRERRSRKLEEQAIGNSQIQQSVAALLRAVPDIETKQYDLRNFAIEYMGMTPQEVDVETSIQARGHDAVKMIARINTAYEKLNVSKRANAKAKAKRSSVEKPGSGFETKTKSTVKELKKQAQKTGDWHSFFLAMEE